MIKSKSLILKYEHEYKIRNNIEFRSSTEEVILATGDDIALLKSSDRTIYLTENFIYTCSPERQTQLRDAIAFLKTRM